MLVKFVLTMDNAIVAGKFYDQLILNWKAEHALDEILVLSHRWIKSTNLLTRSMVGLELVGESSLTIEPQGDDGTPEVHLS